MKGITIAQASKIGSRQGLLSTAIGLVMAQLIMTFFMSYDTGFPEAFFWFTRFDYLLNVIVGAAILLLSGYFFGAIAGRLILIRRYNYIAIGFLTGLLVLLATAFLSGLLGFFQEGWRNIGTNDNPIEDYIFKPLFWIMIFGTIPALVVGSWFGYRIKRLGSKTSSVVEPNC